MAFSVFSIFFNLFNFLMLWHGIMDSQIYECKLIDSFEMWVYRRMFRIPGTVKRTILPILEDKISVGKLILMGDMLGRAAEDGGQLEGLIKSNGS